MQDISIEHIVIIFSFIFAFIYWNNRRRDQEGRLPDLAVTKEKVLKVLSDFEVQGKVTTEAGIQKQLLDFLQNEFYHVQGHKPIGGIHAKQIDFDIGRDRVGIEIKMAKSLFKKSEFDRLHGQMKSYSEYYPDDNLILLVFGTKSELRNRIKQTAVEEGLVDYPVYYEFIEIPA